MSEVLNTVNYASLGWQNNPYSMQSANNAGLLLNYPAQKYGVQVSSSVPSDYFAHSVNIQNGQKNPVANAVDDCLVRLVPKMYLSKYINENTLNAAVQRNPRIGQILATKGLGVKIDLKNVTGKPQEHFLQTYNKAKELGVDLPLDEYASLMQAALLHDIGKAFIPREILDKPAALTPEERQIVDLHAEIGAEVLKTFNLSPKTIEAVRLHHTECSNPSKQNNKMAQILSVADAYTALKEERPYKKPFTNDEVRNIMQNDSRLNQEVVSDLFISYDLSNMKNFAVQKTA